MREGRQRAQAFHSVEPDIEPNPAETDTPGVAAQAYLTLRSQLIAGAFPPGSRLSSRAAAASLDVSRTSAHMALSRLAGDNLVRRLPSGVFEVPAQTFEQINDLYACRASLEVLAAARAVDRAGAVQLDGLQECVDRAGRAYVRGELAEVVACNRLFHERLIAVAGNDWLERALKPLEAHFERFRVPLVAEGRRPLFLSEHQAIVDAISARDAGRAEHAVKTHVASVFSRIAVSDAAVSMHAAPTADGPVA